MDGKARDEMLEEVGATLGRAWDDPMQNFEAYLACRAEYEPILRGSFERDGLRLPRAFWQAFWRRVFPLAMPRQAAAFLDLLYALATRYDDEVDAHFAERLEDGGNNFVEVYGLAGSGKSSAVLGKLHKIRPFKPGALARQVVFDQEKIPEALAAVERFDWIVLDEQTRATGEGSKTSADELANVEEQFRAAQKNMAVLSPTEREHKAQGLRFETFAWNRSRGKVALLVQCNEVWLGHVVWDFCPADVWAEYQPLKDAQVERSIAAAFRDPSAMMRIVNQVAAKPAFVHYLTRAGKPKKRDFETAFKMFHSRSLSTRTLGSIVEAAFMVCYNWDAYKGDAFRQQFGVDPDPGLEQVAKKCYRER